MQPIPRLARQVSINTQDSKTLGDLRDVDETDRTGKGADKSSGFLVGIYNSRATCGFSPEDFADPILAELGLRHLIDGSQDDFPFPGHGRAHHQGDPKIRGPILTVSEK